MGLDLPTPEPETYADPVPTVAAAIADAYNDVEPDDHATVQVTENAMTRHHGDCSVATVRAAVRDYLPTALWARADEQTGRPAAGTSLDQAWNHARGLYERGEDPAPADPAAGIPDGEAAFRRETGAQRARYKAAQRAVDTVLDDLEIERMGGVYTVHFSADR